MVSIIIEREILKGHWTTRPAGLPNRGKVDIPGNRNQVTFIMSETPTNKELLIDKLKNLIDKLEYLPDGTIYLNIKLYISLGASKPVITHIKYKD